MGVKFDLLDSALAQMGAKLDDRPIEKTGKTTPEEIKIELAKGIEILPTDFHKIETVVGMMSHKGEHAFLYIKEPYCDATTLEQIPSIHGPRFHILKECKTLQSMHENGRSKRYFLIQNNSGKFSTHPCNEKRKTMYDREIQAKLLPCRNCLNLIHYLGFRNKNTSGWQLRKEKEYKQIWLNFKVKDFFNHYKPFFFDRKYYNEKCTREHVINRDELLIKIDYRCEEPSCQARLKDKTELLYLHYLNGNKEDVSTENLRIYCIICHNQKNINKDEKISIKSGHSFLISRRRRDVQDK